MAPKDKEAVELTASPDKKKDDAKGNKNKKDEIQVDSLSEEDKELKERLETCVDTVVNKDKEAAVTVALRLKALDVIVNELRTATSSMTSVPKPLKFLRPHFTVLKDAVYTPISKLQSDEISAADNEMIELRARLADVLAVLAMTLGKPEERESLHFKLAATRDYDLLASRGVESQHGKQADNLGSWGHEFVRSLAGEIGQEYGARVLEKGADPEDDAAFADILKMVDVIVPFHVTHNAEAEAVDLLIEVQRLKKLLTLGTGDNKAMIDENNFQRICLYLIKTADYMSDPDDFVVRAAHLYLYSFAFVLIDEKSYLSSMHVFFSPSLHALLHHHSTRFASCALFRKCSRLHMRFSKHRDSTLMRSVWRSE
jgi:26S proteasome regulatory subunit N1